MLVAPHAWHLCQCFYHRFHHMLEDHELHQHDSDSRRHFYHGYVKPQTLHLEL